MIRINLLTVERTRTRAKKPAVRAGGAAGDRRRLHRAARNGSRYRLVVLVLRTQSQMLDREIAKAETDTRNLRSVSRRSRSSRPAKGSSSSA